MDGAILVKRRRGEAADDFNWVTRAKLQSVMNEHYHRCKAPIEQHLDAYYGERQGSVFARAGVTARASVDLFETQAVKLAGALVESARQPSCNARAFQMASEMTNGFLTYIDLVVARIGPRIDLEMRNMPRSESMPRSAGELWVESRARVLESLDRHRPEFGLPEKAEPVAALAELAAEVPELALEMEVDVFETEVPMLLEEEAREPLPAPSLPPEPSPLPPILPSHWQDAWAEIAVQLCTGTFQPKAQGDLADAMTQWFAAQGIEGLEAEVEQCARRFWRKFAGSRRVTSSLAPGGDYGATFDGPRSAGLTTGGNALSRREEIRCSTAIVSPLAALAADNIPHDAAKEEPFEGIRYHVSWSMRKDSPLPAPYFDLG